MRISCKSGDPGYDPMAVGRYKVFVNDKAVTERCYTADEELGKAWCYVLNKDKKVIRKNGDGSSLLTEVVSGVVKVEVLFR